MENDQNKQKSKRRVRLRHWIVAVCILLFIFLLTSYGLRSSLYLKARLTPKLAELGEKLDGQFEFKNIRAMGVTGLVLDHVKFTPNNKAVQPLTFESVTVYPALLGMFVGDLNASLVEVKGLKASFNAENSHTPDIEWLKSIAERATTEGHNDIIETGITAGSAPSRSIPLLTCNNCELEAKIKNDVKITVSVEHQNADLDTMEQLSFSGNPVKVCAVKGNQNTCFNLSIGDVRMSNGITLSHAELTNFNFRGVELKSLSLDGLQLGHNDQRNVVFVQNGVLDGHIDESAGIKALTGDYMFEFSELEMLHERLQNRIGIGIRLREPSGSSARFYGGYSLDENKLALSFDTNKFDLARFVQDADFTKWLRLDSIPISGHVSTIIELDEKNAWFDIDAGITQGVMYSPALAADVLRDINGHITMSAWIDGINKTFALENASGTMGKIPFEVALSRTKTVDDSYQFDANITLSGESGDFIDSIPEGFAPALTGYQLRGPFDLRLALSYDEANIDALLLDTTFNLDNVETVAFDPRSDFNLLKGNAFKVRVKAATVPIEIGPREPTWVTFYDLPRETSYAFVASEDSKFFTHHGFDIKAIRASMIADLKAEKVVRGGSTISQQVIKNLFLNHDKTASRKFQEAFLTWQMERTLPKLRIFEMYLNLAHWAKDTYGIRGAAQFYFQKNVSQLTLRESLFLASILPNPIIFGRQYAEGKLSSSRLNKMINVGNALRQANRIKADFWETEQALIHEGKISDRPKPVIEP